MYKLLWVDCEFSGLNVEENQIIEIACILTDEKCQQLVQGPELVIHASQGHLAKMDEWNTQHHGASGLTQKCLESKLSTAQAEQAVLDFLGEHKCEPRQLLLAGNSIHSDKVFIMKHMPKLYAFLHYRILDVSTLKTMVAVHRPAWKYSKKEAHRALDDIKESIGEYRFYTKMLFGASD